MKQLLRGRAIDVEIEGDVGQVAARLVDRGLERKVGEAIAEAAVTVATRETERLTTELIPPIAWPGTMVCARHVNAGRVAYLLLRRGSRTWNLNAALFD